MDESDGFGKIVLESELQAPVGLLEKILFSIARRERRSATLKFAAYSCASALVAILLFFSWSAANAAFYRNGTSQLFSLVFSDFQSILANWNYFILSVIESLPVLEIIYLLLSVAVLSVLISLAAANVRNIGRIRNFGLKHAR
ncbi:MAG: hypothetical protein ABSF47_00430 [Minisyncoccia bacterium]|jgi:hypothetical protein